MQAPAAERRPKQLSTHNDVRSDPYYWLRDDEREDPAVSGLCSEAIQSSASCHVDQTHAEPGMQHEHSHMLLCSASCVQASEQRSCRVRRCLRT